MKQAVPVIAALAVVGVFSTAVYAQTADRMIRYRQAVMSAQGHHMFQVLGGMVKGTRPYDKDAAVRSATYIDQLMEMPWEGFAPGTERGAPTRAKPEIWTNRAKWDKHIQDTKAETKKLVSVAGNGLDALRTGVTSASRACNACHDDFQNKDLSN
jgi:cytochrome c556